MQLFTILAAAAALIPGTTAVEFEKSECNARFAPFLDHSWEYGKSQRWSDAVAAMRMQAHWSESDSRIVPAGPGKCLSVLEDAKTKELEGGVFICNDESDDLPVKWEDIIDAFYKIYADCSDAVDAGKSSYQMFTKKGSEPKWNIILRGV